MPPSSLAAAASSTPNKHSPTTRRQPHSIALLLLFIAAAAQNVAAGPVSNPEINSKNGKSQNTQTSASLKSNTQDAQLNSLTAYATNYDSISNDNTQQHPSFKPSYKLPEMETNFTPIQSINSPALGNPTPVLMQYLPQQLQEGGVQYLQLIPTRPLIVPISPYLTGGASGASFQPAFHPPLAAAANANNNVIPDYAARAPTMLTAMPQNANGLLSPAATATTLVDLAGAPPYGLTTYANGLQHGYRTGYRINRETKGKHFPGGLTLNLNEYIPGPHETAHPSFVRGRP